MSDLKRSKRLMLVALTAGLLFIIIPAVLFASSINGLDDVNRPADSFAGQTVPTRTPVLTDTGWLPLIQNDFMPTFTPTPTATVTPTPSPSNTPDTSSCLPNPPIDADNATIEDELASAINGYRSENSLPGYTVNDRLVQAARRHAQDMGNLTENQLFSAIHTGTDGTVAATRIDEACYETKFGTEIAGFGFTTVSGMMQWWKDSPIHNPLLLHQNLKDFGPAYFNHPSTQYKHFWVVTLGDPDLTNRNQPLYHCTYSFEDKAENRAISISTWQETPCSE